MPGIATPTEILMAVERGLSILKFFPAEALGGIPLLEAIAAPFPELRFVPTGGISPSNLADYLRLPMVMRWVEVGWSRKLLKGEQFGEITRPRPSGGRHRRRGPRKGRPAVTPRIVTFGEIMLRLKSPGF